MLDAFSVQLVGHAHLDGIQFIQNIQLGDGEAVKTVHLNRITPDHPIEPTASPPPACGGAEFAATLGELVVESSTEFRRERPFADAGGVGLGNADHPVDQRRPHTGTDACPTGHGIR